jgi:hypothetical protein
LLTADSQITLKKITVGEIDGVQQLTADKLTGQSISSKMVESVATVSVNTVTGTIEAKNATTDKLTVNQDMRVGGSMSVGDNTVVRGSLGAEFIATGTLISLNAKINVIENVEQIVLSDTEWSEKPLSGGGWGWWKKDTLMMSLTED